MRNLPLWIIVTIAAIIIVLKIAFSLPPKSESTRVIRFSDSMKAARMVDSIGIAVVREAYSKAASNSYDKSLISSPIKIISAKFIQEEYSSYKSVRLVYKNVSPKRITAIRFKWEGVNAFDEPADMSTGIPGLGGGFTDDALNPGKTDNATWSILSRDGKKITKAWAYEIVFSDGSKWSLPD